MRGRLGSLSHILLFLLLVMLALAGYLLVRNRVAEGLLTARLPTATPYVIQIPTTVAPGSPVTKLVYKDGSTAQYRIRGRFTVLERQTHLFVGSFTLAGDPGQREFTVALGSLDGTLTLGRYTGSFKGGSKWRGVPYEDVLPLISGGREVELQASLPLDPTDASFPTHQKLERQSK